MFSRKSILTAVVTLLPFIGAQDTQVISLEDTPKNTLEATAFALIVRASSLTALSICSWLRQFLAIQYALPLIQLVSQTSAVFKVVGGTNKINAQLQLASLSSAAVVKPNVDTIYNRVIIDLSENDLELSIPAIDDRFWIYPFYDT